MKAHFFLKKKKKFSFILQNTQMPKKTIILEYIVSAICGLYIAFNYVWLGSHSVGDLGKTV